MKTTTAVWGGITAFAITGAFASPKPGQVVNSAKSGIKMSQKAAQPTMITKPSHPQARGWFDLALDQPGAESAVSDTASISTNYPTMSGTNSTTAPVGQTSRPLPTSSLEACLASRVGATITENHIVVVTEVAAMVGTPDNREVDRGEIVYMADGKIIGDARDLTSRIHSTAVVGSFIATITPHPALQPMVYAQQMLTLTTPLVVTATEIDRVGVLEAIITGPEDAPADSKRDVLMTETADIINGTTWNELGVTTSWNHAATRRTFTTTLIPVGGYTWGDAASPTGLAASTTGFRDGSTEQDPASNANISTTSTGAMQSKSTGAIPSQPTAYSTFQAIARDHQSEHDHNEQHDQNLPLLPDASLDGYPGINEHLKHENYEGDRFDTADDGLYSPGNDIAVSDVSASSANKDGFYNVEDEKPRTDHMSDSYKEGDAWKLSNHHGSENVEEPHRYEDFEDAFEHHNDYGNLYPEHTAPGQSRADKDESHRAAWDSHSYDNFPDPSDLYTDGHHPSANQYNHLSDKSAAKNGKTNEHAEKSAFDIDGLVGDEDEDIEDYDIDADVDGEFEGEFTTGETAYLKSWRDHSGNVAYPTSGHHETYGTGEDKHHGLRHYNNDEDDLYWELETGRYEDDEDDQFQWEHEAGRYADATNDESTWHAKTGHHDEYNGRPTWHHKPAYHGDDAWSHTEWRYRQPHVYDAHYHAGVSRPHPSPPENAEVPVAVVLPTAVTETPAPTATVRLNPDGTVDNVPVGMVPALLRVVSQYGRPPSASVPNSTDQQTHSSNISIFSTRTIISSTSVSISTVTTGTNFTQSPSAATSQAILDDDPVTDDLASILNEMEDMSTAEDKPSAVNSSASQITNTSSRNVKRSKYASKGPPHNLDTAGSALSHASAGASPPDAGSGYGHSSAPIGYPFKTTARYPSATEYADPAYFAGTSTMATMAGSGYGSGAAYSTVPGGDPAYLTKPPYANTAAGPGDAADAPLYTAPGGSLASSSYPPDAAAGSTVAPAYPAYPTNAAYPTVAADPAYAAPTLSSGSYNTAAGYSAHGTPGAAHTADRGSPHNPHVPKGKRTDGSTASDSDGYPKLNSYDEDIYSSAAADAGNGSGDESGRGGRRQRAIALPGPSTTLATSIMSKYAERDWPILTEITTIPATATRAPTAGAWKPRV